MLRDLEMANAVAMDYKKSSRQEKKEDITKEDLDFLDEFASLVISEGSKGRLFDILYKNADDVDKLKNQKGFADFFIKNIILKEEIEDKLWRNGKPIAFKS